MGVQVPRDTSPTQTLGTASTRDRAEIAEDVGHRDQGDSSQPFPTVPTAPASAGTGRLSRLGLRSQLDRQAQQDARPQPVGSQRSPSLSSQMIDSPSPATPVIP
jgi:hypothetical protein